MKLSKRKIELMLVDIAIIICLYYMTALVGILRLHSIVLNGELNLTRLAALVIMLVTLDGLIRVFAAVGVEELIAVPGQQCHQQNSHGHDHVHANAQIHRKPHPTDEHQNQIGYKIRNHNGQISLDIGVAPNISVHTA